MVAPYLGSSRFFCDAVGARSVPRSPERALAQTIQASVEGNADKTRPLCTQPDWCKMKAGNTEEQG
jgi:hypothetical protein